MFLLEYIIPFLIALGGLVFFHELGHYLVARCCGVRIERFSIGFGKPLLIRRLGRDQTEWVLAAIPLGGYVKMLDSREQVVPPQLEYRAFDKQSVGKRIAIVAAGPLANFLLAIILFWGILVLAGQNGLKPYISVSAETGAVAYQSGLRDGDLIKSVNGSIVRSWSDLNWQLLDAAMDKQAVVLDVAAADGQQVTRTLDLSGIVMDENLFATLGIEPWYPDYPPTVRQVQADSAAGQAGIQPGDEFLMIDGEVVPSWRIFQKIIRESAGKTLYMTLRRNGSELSLTVTPKTVMQDNQPVGLLGVTPEVPKQLLQQMTVHVQYGMIDGLAGAVQKTWRLTVFSFKAMWRMVTGDISWNNLSGPVTIADHAGQTARMGLLPYLNFVALISIAIGTLNLLPIPVLDGGFLLYYIAELIKGSPVSEKVMVAGQQIGFVLLFMLMALALFNDLNRHISI